MSEKTNLFQISKKIIKSDFNGWFFNNHIYCDSKII